MSEVVRLADGTTVFLCSRGRGSKRYQCRGIGQPAGRFTLKGVETWLCGDANCRREVDVYESADGRMIAHQHKEGQR